MSSSSSKLFEPIQVGDLQLQHRVVLAPLTRFKTDGKKHVPIVKLVKEYYAQRASMPGTLLISEAAYIGAKAGGYPYAPGLYTDEQLAAWKEITDAVHAKKSFFYAQLWALGRAASPEALRAEDASFPYVSASAIKLNGQEETPSALSVEEIKEYVQMYAQAAKNSVEKGGFDGVEIHGANGYLIDQFIQDVSNHRTDAYGGSVENRARFALEVVDAVVEAVGAEKTGIRLSPWSPFQDMGMQDPVPTFSYVVSQIKERHPNLSYIHVVEPRINGNADCEHTEEKERSNDFIRDIWAPRPLITAGGYTPEHAIERANATGDLVAFGRRFIANPDLPARIKNNIPLTPYDRDTFYLMGDVSKGYIDWPFAS